VRTAIGDDEHKSPPFRLFIARVVFFMHGIVIPKQEMRNCLHDRLPPIPG
jgi:hypothetical protein